MQHRLCIMHSFDPLGDKVGGVETFIRDILGALPDDFSALMVGVDLSGKRPLGVVSRETHRGKPFEYMPVLHFSELEARGAANKLKDSLNLQFLQGMVLRLPAVRRALKSSPTSVDLQRVEFAAFVRGLGVPFSQMLHSEGAPKLQMDSLLKKYPYVHSLNEWISVAACDRFSCVNPVITERIKATYPAHAHKIDTQTTWVDTKLFKPRPYPAEGFRIAFAGRLDLFKVPSLMFKSVQRVREKLPAGSGVEFHYMGTSDPERFPEFAAIRDIAVLHGFKTANGVAEVLSNVHAGILTSEFEGMPFSVLETIGAGRPVCAIHLPQLPLAIKDGKSGMLVARSDDADDMANRLADAFVATHAQIKSGAITPESVAAEVSDFAPEKQIPRIFEKHREIQRARFGDKVRSA